MLPAVCRECSLRFTCGGGCKTEAYVASGSLSAPDPYCTGNPVVIQRTRKMLGLTPSITFHVNPVLKTREEMN
jgi:sulfatase maturation enzyme AslB (radical SAM superfamily)